MFDVATLLIREDDIDDEDEDKDGGGGDDDDDGDFLMECESLLIFKDGGDKPLPFLKTVVVVVVVISLFAWNCEGLMVLVLK